MGNNIKKKKKLLHELLLLGEKNDFMSNEFVSYLFHDAISDLTLAVSLEGV